MVVPIKLDNLAGSSHIDDSFSSLGLELAAGYLAQPYIFITHTRGLKLPALLLAVFSFLF